MIFGEACRRAAVAAALSLLVTACSGSNSAPTLPATGSTTAPPSVSAAAPTPSTAEGTPESSRPRAAPVLPAAGGKPTAAGAEAFFRFFLETYNYGYAQGLSAPLARISGAGCKFCASAIADIDAAARTGNQVQGGAVTVTEVVVAPGVPEVGLIIDARLSQAASVTRSKSGTEVASADAQPPFLVKAKVEWDTAGWVVAGLDVVT